MTDPRDPQAAPDETADDVDTPTSVDAAEDLALVIESKRAEAEAALSEQRDKYLRLAAEYDNFRKRAIRDRETAEHSGQASVVRGLLDALDDLARFAHVDPAGTDVRTVVDGAALVEQKLLKSLAGHGLEVVNPAGHPFDPTFHEAVSTVPATSAAEDHLVAQVYQVGYVLRGQLLRPARVVVKQWAG
ncbi:MAG TPA: nucleotide exchange factor GrpE [Gemmatimonadaceae bacterium]|nr:nucleotide exchange factor GrpE [Gemmatimonadaceae bacterium]